MSLAKLITRNPFQQIKSISTLPTQYESPYNPIFTWILGILNFYPKMSLWVYEYDGLVILA